MGDFRTYIERVVERAGRDVAVGRFLGFADRSRVGLWRKGEGRPDELNCIKLARWMGDDPLQVLRLAGYTEMADLLKGTVGPAPIQIDTLRPQLVGLLHVVSGVIATIEEQQRMSKSNNGGQQ